MKVCSIQLVGVLAAFITLSYATDDDGVESCDFGPYPGEFSEPQPGMRSNIFTRDYHGYVVAYPSIGGVVLMEPCPLTMQYLNLSRTHDTQRSEGDEDLMASSLLRIGGTWWPDWDTYRFHRVGMLTTPYRYHFPPRTEVAYPSTGGVWVVKYNADEPNTGPPRIPPSEDDGIEDIANTQKTPNTNTDVQLPHLPRGWWKTDWALTMDERAAWLEKFGAVFYTSAEECPDLATSPEQGKAIYETYADKLKNMTDHDHVDKWLRYLYYGPPEKEPASQDESNEKNRWGFISRLGFF